MKYRSRTEIISQILRCIGDGGCTKTKMMYKAYMSYAQMKEYIKFLEEKNLVRYEEGTQLYKATEKGRGFLRKYNEMLEMIDENHYTTDEAEYTSTSRTFI